MQLSVSSPTLDPNFAPSGATNPCRDGQFAFGPVTTTSSSGTPAGADATGFADLFPDLVSDEPGAIPEDDPAGMAAYILPAAPVLGQQPPMSVTALGMFEYRPGVEGAGPDGMAVEEGPAWDSMLETGIEKRTTAAVRAARFAAAGPKPKTADGLTDSPACGAAADSLSPGLMPIGAAPTIPDVAVATPEDETAALSPRLGFPAWSVAANAPGGLTANAAPISKAALPSAAALVSPSTNPAFPVVPSPVIAAAAGDILDDSVSASSGGSENGKPEEVNIADLPMEKSVANIFRRSGGVKTFLNAENEKVTNDSSVFGIDVAKSRPDMPTLDFKHPASPIAEPDPAASVQAAVAPTEVRSFEGRLVIATDFTGVHQAVEAALSAADRFTAVNRQSVNLKFSIGGAELAVRVELRADEVHATFQTDSPDLRAALAYEWQAMRSDTAEREFRLASPVFASNSANPFGLTAFADGNSPGQRDPRSTNDSGRPVVSRGRRTVSSAIENVAPSPALLSLPTSLRLQAHA